MKKKKKMMMMIMMMKMKMKNNKKKMKNSPKTKSQRIDYFEFFVENNNSTFIYIDEVGYSIGAQQKWGRLQKGVK